MFNELNRFAGGTCESPQAMMPMQRTLLERLKFEKSGLEDRLTRINDVLIALEANPTIADVVEKLSRV